MIKDLPDDLERYIFDGVAETRLFHVFTKEQEGELAAQCAREGLVVTYRSHDIEYMGKVATITYPSVSGQSAGAQVALIPWFMQIGRPYPIFANIYGVWHYMESGRKSMRESAEAVAKVFGIAGFNKSTICRNLKGMDRIYGGALGGGPLSAEERETPAFEELALLIPKLLKASQAGAMPGEPGGGAQSAMPCGGPAPADGGGLTASPNPTARATASRGEAAHAALGAIPRRLSEVIKANGPAPQSRRDARKRPPRRRRAGAKGARRAPPFASPQAIGQARREFIAACRNIAIDAAIKYHSPPL
jgi:hypothetical protein